MEKYTELIEKLRDPSNVGKLVNISWDRGNGQLPERNFILTGFKDDVPQLAFEDSYRKNQPVFFDKDLIQYITSYHIK